MMTNEEVLDSLLELYRKVSSKEEINGLGMHLNMGGLL